MNGCLRFKSFVTALLQIIPGKFPQNSDRIIDLAYKESWLTFTLLMHVTDKLYYLSNMCHIDLPRAAFIPLSGNSGIITLAGSICIAADNNGPITYTTY